MLTSYLHEFHFVMGRGMKKSLKSLDLYKKFGSLSGVVVKIVALLAPVVKREHNWGEQRKSRYLPVSSNPDDIREHVHVYFPGDVYRQLKLIHQDLNVYSIAQLLREFLEFFLDMVKKYGNNVFQELQKLFKQWKDEDKKNKLTSHKFIRQLWKIIQHLHSQEKIISIYNKEFSPFWVFRL